MDIIKHYFGVDNASSPAYKMAKIPRKASLNFGSSLNMAKPNTYPYIVLENVYVFPGSPVFFEKSFQSLYKVNILMRVRDKLLLIIFFNTIRTLIFYFRSYFLQIEDL